MAAPCRFPAGAAAVCGTLAGPALPCAAAHQLLRRRTFAAAAHHVTGCRRQSQPTKPLASASSSSTSSSDDGPANQAAEAELVAQRTAMLSRLAAALLASKPLLVANWRPAAPAALLLGALGAQAAAVPAWAAVWQVLASYAAEEMQQHCRGKQLSLFLREKRHLYATHRSNFQMLAVLAGVVCALLERQLRSKQASLPAEPPADDAEAINLMVRLPAGGRCSRRFRRSDPLQAVFDFVDVQSGVGGDIAPGTYHLATAFPRRVVEDGAGAQTLEEAGLSAKQEALFLELK